MTRPMAAGQVWLYRGLFVGLAVLILAVRLLPLNTDGQSLIGPDLLLAFCVAWLMRQPAVVPLPIIIAVFLLADFVLQQPPGLFALLVILATESLRRRRVQMTELPFLQEWGVFAVTVIAITLVQRIVLWALMVDMPGLGGALIHAIVTIAAYPLVVLVSIFVFRLRMLSVIPNQAT